MEIKITIDDSEISSIASKLGYQSRINSVNQAKQIVKIDNPVSESEYIQSVFDKIIPAAKLQHELKESRSRAVKEQQDIEKLISDKPEYSNLKKTSNESI